MEYMWIMGKCDDCGHERRMKHNEQVKPDDKIIATCDNPDSAHAMKPRQYTVIVVGKWEDDDR